MLLLLGQDNFSVEIMHELDVFNECATLPTDGQSLFGDATKRFESESWSCYKRGTKFSFSTLIGLFMKIFVLIGRRTD